MARPTTTSAAATTMTKKAIDLAVELTMHHGRRPRRPGWHALSMSSTHMNTTIAFRRTSTPIGADHEQDDGQGHVVRRD